MPRPQGLYPDLILVVLFLVFFSFVLWVFAEHFAQKERAERQDNPSRPPESASKAPPPSGFVVPPPPL